MQLLEGLVALSSLWGLVNAANLGEVQRCEGLATLDLAPLAHIESAEVAHSEQTPTGDVNWAGPATQRSQSVVEDYCRVVIINQPSSQSLIRSEVWLPLKDWNHRLLGIGNAGYPLDIDRRSMAAGLARHYAVATTDMGLAAYQAELAKTTAAADTTALFIGHPMRLVDFASRSTHEMTVSAKAVVRRFYNADPTVATFAGCSTGGMQGFSEAQRYPEDYDTILAGDPGANRARLHLGILWDFLTVWHQPERVIPQDKLLLLHETALRACGAAPDEGYLRNPALCRWDPGQLTCRVGETRDCLSEAQVVTARLVYQGPRNPRTGESIAPGLPYGSELGWKLYMDQADKEEPPFLGLFRSALGPNMSIKNFDWDRDADSFIAVLSPLIDAFDPDLTRFAAHGGRLLIYYGGSDPLTPPEDSVHYFEKVEATASTRKGAQPVGDYLRLFILPGMDHCGGGAGDDQFDGLGLLDSWRSFSIGPTSLSSHRAPSAPEHVVCAYPLLLHGKSGGACEAGPHKPQ